MKNGFLSILILSSLVAFYPIISNATNPEVSKWIKNISEGQGAPTLGFDDYGPEMAVSGKVIHMLWTANNNWVTKDMYYRRSPDGGNTWEVKKLLVSNAGLDDVVRSQKLYVSGNYVHISYILKVGLGPSELFYLRSTDGGQTFETPKVLYSVPQSMTELKVKGYGSHITIAAIHYCHYCADINIIHLFNSENNGVSFIDQVVPGNYNGYEFLTWDLAVEGNNIYLMLMESVGNWADYNYNLHIFSSNNRGQTFKDNIISVPAMSGQHHPFTLMDYNWGYTRKMAAKGNAVWVIWSGWNAENIPKIFVSGSQDGGNSFSTAKEISGAVGTFQSGHETIIFNGAEIYASFLKTNGQIYVVKSHNSGATFDPPYEFTLPNDTHLRSGWGPLLLADPANQNAHLLHSGPVHGVLSPATDYPSQDNLACPTLKDQRYITAAFDQDGILHIAFQGGRVWLSTGVFTDYEIFYRRVDPGFTTSETEDHTLALAAKENPGDGSGQNRFDKMLISPDPAMKFTNAMTIEVWVKPEVDRAATYITQDHVSTWHQGQVAGFILWSDGYQPLVPVTNILTTSGQYPMSSPRKMQLNAWNHLAVTYDKDGGAQNYRMYLNGQLVVSTTSVGEIVSPDVKWIIGAFKDAYYRETFQGQMDELRFWNIARTPEQINQGLYEILNGNEEGLVAYYNFNEISPDGQVDDVTDNGHQGYLIYYEESKPGTIKDIGVRFDYVQTGSAFYFTQKTDGGEKFDWSFGDTHTSTEVNPVHKYDTPGTFQVCLTASGQGNSGTYCETLIIEGIARVFPTEGGNTGGITLNIFGGGFASTSQAILRRAGEPDLLAIKNIYDPGGSVTAVFDLSGVPIGEYDVIVTTGGNELVLPKGFKIVVGEKAQPWVKYLGGGTMLVHRWTPQTIVVGNSANVDAYGVVLWVAVPNDPDFDILFLNLNVQKPQLAIDNGWTDELDALGLYSVVDTLFGKPSDSRLYSFYFPYLPAKSSINISVRVRTKLPIRNDVQVAVSAPFYASPLSPYVQGCIAFAAAKAFIKAGVAFIPGAGCITGGLGLVSSIVEDNPPTPSAHENIDVRSFGWNIATALLECATSVGAPVVAGTLALITSSVEAKQEHEDCLRGFWPSPFTLFQINYWGVTSLDPNEKKGPVGFGEENFIPVTGQLSYQINFENKSTATAPAQEVFVTDTLDSPLYDLKIFSFGPVAFGDSTFYPISNTYEFGMESDLRPLKNAIVRMTGQMDTLTRIVKWQFTALDPITRDLVTDPFGGFLPPNIESPEGEGYVTFSVGLKPVNHMNSVSNIASIVFDLNPPIITNAFLNTFDMMAPESQLTAQSTVSTDMTFTVNAEGTDDGCGIRHYEIYVSTNNQPYELYRYTGSQIFEFTGDYGNTYRLYSIAVDSIGNVEEAPGNADIEVSIVTSVKDLSEWIGVKLYPTPAGNSVYLEFTLEESSMVNCSIYDMNGREVQHFFAKPFGGGFHQVEMDITASDGIYLLKLSSKDRLSYQKLIMSH